MSINIIVCIDKNNGIGYQGTIPWKSKKDMRYFRKMTTNGVCIMGRKTFQSIGKLLPQRINVIITRNSKLEISGAIIKTNVKSAIETFEGKDIWIIGGEQIYNDCLVYATKIYKTVIDKEFVCDRFFTNVSNDFKFVSSTKELDGDLPLDFQVYERKI